MIKNCAFIIFFTFISCVCGGCGFGLLDLNKDVSPEMTTQLVDNGESKLYINLPAQLIDKTEELGDTGDMDCNLNTMYWEDGSIAVKVCSMKIADKTQRFKKIKLMKEMERAYLSSYKEIDGISNYKESDIKDVKCKDVKAKEYSISYIDKNNMNYNVAIDTVLLTGIHFDRWYITFVYKNGDDKSKAIVEKIKRTIQLED